MSYNNNHYELRAENLKAKDLKNWLEQQALDENALNPFDALYQKTNIHEIVGPKGCGKTFKVFEMLETILDLQKEVIKSQNDGFSERVNSLNKYLNGKKEDVTVKYLQYSNGKFEDVNLAEILPSWTPANKASGQGGFGDADILVIDDIHYAFDDIFESCMSLANNCSEESIELPELIQNKVDSLIALLNDAVAYSNKGKKVILVSEDSFTDKRLCGEAGVFEDIDPRFNELFQNLDKYVVVDIPSMNRGYYKQLVRNGIFEEGLEHLLPKIVNTPRAALRIATELRKDGDDSPISLVDILNYTIKNADNSDLNNKIFRKKRYEIDVDELKNIIELHNKFSSFELDTKVHEANNLEVWMDEAVKKDEITPQNILNKWLRDLRSEGNKLSNNDISEGYINWVESSVKNTFDAFKFSNTEFCFESPEYFEILDYMKEILQPRIAPIALNSLNGYIRENGWIVAPIIKSGFKKIVDEQYYLTEKIGKRKIISFC